MPVLHECPVVGMLTRGAAKKVTIYLSRDLPVMIWVIDSAEKLDEAAAAIEQMMSDGLIVMCDVEVIRVIHACSSWPCQM